MRMSLKAGLAVAGMAVVTTAAAQVTFYAGEGFHGPSFTADSSAWNMDRTGFNDRASSAVVRGGSWEVCEHARFEGRCIVLQPGEYPSLAALGMNNNVSSARPASYVLGQSPPAYSQRWRSDRSSTYSHGDRSTYYRDDNGYYSYGDPHRNYLNEYSYDRLDPYGIENHDTN